MDPRLLRLYSDELTHLREVGAEFAHEFPKIASRLGMEGLEVRDPYVERLLEGFAFMAARVQTKLEAEQPRLIAQLLESIYPNFLAPVPSMMVARFTVDPGDPNLGQGHEVPRGSAIVSELPRGHETHCEFRTAHAVTLWPIEIVDARYRDRVPGLPPAAASRARGALVVRLRCGGGLRFARLGLDRLAFHIAAPDDAAYRLHELVTGTSLGSWIAAAGASTPSAAAWRGPASVRPLGFAPDEALLPDSPRAFSGYRLMQELAAMPRRLLFFEVGDLAARLAGLDADELEIVLPFARADAGLEPLIERDSLALFCTPAINLFRKRLDRVQLGPGAWEYHVVPDRSRPMDHEVHSLDTVVGHGTGAVAHQVFRPLYATRHDAGEGGAEAPAHGWYTVRREPRLASRGQQERGARSAYLGEEVYVSLVDPRHAPYREDIRQLSISAWVTNRDLPLSLPHAAPPDAPPVWRLEVPGPVNRVEAVRAPTRPVSRRPVGELGWRLVSHLGTNHLALVGETPQQAAAVLRSTLALYAPPEDAAWARQLAGVQALAARQVVRRLPFDGPPAFGTGVELVLELDELAFQGSSAFLFASVLERFFARHAAINAFTQLALRTMQRGEIVRWPPRGGARETA